MSFQTHDYFEDGSFYLLDSSGHCAGHISALARKASSSVDGEVTSLFLGGDIYHFAGNFRPSLENTLPENLPDGLLSRRKTPIRCPCSLASNHPNASDEIDARTTPWYKIASEFPTAYREFSVSRSSILKMQAMDQDDNVLVCLAP